MTQNILEFTFLVVILAVIFITIFRLYISNIRLKNRYFALKEQALSLKAQNQILQNSKEELDRLKEIENSYNQLLGKYSKLQEELEQKSAQNALYLTQLQEKNAKLEQFNILKDTLKEKEELIKNLKEQMSLEFKNLSNELLEKKQESIQKSSKEQLQQILEPFDKELKEFKDTILKINRQQNSSIGILRGELNQLKELNSSLSKEAKELALALKGDNKLQGNWGELILQKALEASGLQEGKEYKREVELTQDDKKYRADVILYLPEGKHIVIDSKVSLKSYIEVIKNTSNKEVLKQNKIALLQSIKRHINTLSFKNYHFANELLSPELTLMFIPIEQAFAIALEIDNTLLEYALSKGVSIVTPTTLFATLRSVATIWKLSDHDKNMQILAKEASSLHYKFALFLEEFNKINKRLIQAQESWESAKIKLSSGQGSLYSKIQKVGELSGRAKKELPKLIED